MSSRRAKWFFAITASCSMGALAWASWYAFAPIPSGAPLATTVDPSSSSSAAKKTVALLQVPARVLAITLRDDLFPDPPPPPRETPLPRLDLELIAIYGEGDTRSAFVYSPSDGDYHELAAGDETPGGATLAALEPTAAVFHLAGHEVRLELRP